MKTTTSPRIAFDDVGDREPALLCLPGWCAPREVFRPLLPLVDRRALAVDWRGHGGSDAPAGDFGGAELVEDALAVVATAGVDRFIPVATAHAGWVAIELRRRLGPVRMPGVVLVDWMVLGAPPPFFGALGALQDPASWSAVRDRLFAMWTEGVEAPAVHDFIAKMGGFDHAMWSRAGREIARAFEACPVPLDALRDLACPTLHVYAQPTDPGFLAAQESYAAARSWFAVERVAASSHFPALEAPVEVAAAVCRFAARVA